MQMENCISPQKHDLSCLHFSPRINVLTWLINKRPKEKKDLLESLFCRKNILTYINILKITISFVKYQIPIFLHKIFKVAFVTLDTAVRCLKNWPYTH